MGADLEAMLYYGFTQQRDKDGDFVVLTLDQIVANGLATPEQRALFAKHADEAELDAMLESMDDESDDDDGDSEGPWSEHHGGLLRDKPWNVTIGLIGSGYMMGHFLAIPESLISVEWDQVANLDALHVVRSKAEFAEWDKRLWTAVKDWGLNVHEDKPGWHLSALYF